MRFIFEILQINKDVMNNEYISAVNPHFYKHFYRRLYNCINKDRKKTIININTNKLLIQLHRSFKTFDKYNNIVIPLCE